jgi:membrane-bound hydrogenase subunit mbhJ
MSYAVNALTKSLNVFHLAGSACNNCDIEILDALTPRYDLERFGITLVGSVRHADVLLLSGIFNKKARTRMLEVLAQAPRPYLVVAIGGCPASGLMFRDSYNFYAAPGEYVPIDAYIPGCPPKPEAIISGVLTVIAALREGAIVPKCLTEPVRASLARDLTGDREISREQGSLLQGGRTATEEAAS